ncbi:hypothetical protein FIC_00741 [Flavobacteriaceae bacterium 3519-10]|nr:hypothetical protein FIC_00741 [Flavobacteriaceae bacterium 3519-10]
MNDAILDESATCGTLKISRDFLNSFPRFITKKNDEAHFILI